jgi:uncharacterized protein (TIGR02217 family)
MFIDLEFPRRIAMGAVRTPAWSTDLQVVRSGRTTSNENWANARHSYDVALAVRTATDYSIVLDHFHSARGRANFFLFKDFLDYRVEQPNGVLLNNSGSPGEYHLAKTYGTGPTAWTRRITRPRQGYVTVYRTRAGSTTEIAVSIDYQTGELGITGDIVGDTYSWSGQFYVPVRYGSDEMPAMVPNRKGNSGDLLVICDSITLIQELE